MYYLFIMRRFVYIGKNPRFTAFLDSNLHTRLTIVTANELGFAFPPRNLPKKFLPDPSTFYLVIVVTNRQTDRQTDRQTNQRRWLHNPSRKPNSLWNVFHVQQPIRGSGTSSGVRTLINHEVAVFHGSFVPKAIAQKCGLLLRMSAVASSNVCLM